MVYTETKDPPGILSKITPSWIFDRVHLYDFAYNEMSYICLVECFFEYLNKNKMLHTYE